MPSQSRLSLLVWAIVCVAGVGEARAQLCFQIGKDPIQENFDTLAVSGTSNFLVPIGFGFKESPGNLIYAADAGASDTGNTYSYGTGTSTERAFGELTSVTVHSYLGSCIVNVGGDLTWLEVGYTGEEWRLGAADATIDRLDFQYSTDAVSLTEGTWVDVDALDFVTPNNVTVGAKDGNAASNRTVLAPVRIFLTTPLPALQTMHLRWVATDIAGEDDGLAIDDFSIEVHTECTVDVDGNGEIDPLTDAVLLLRATFGFTGNVLTTGALGAGAVRNEGGEIVRYLNASCGTSLPQ